MSNLIANLLAETKVNPALLEIELTESTFIDQTNTIITDIHALKQLGITLAIDDFGTYYASLSYLKRFVFNNIKIDRTFVRDINKSKEDRSIVLAIIAMANHLGLNVTAEGIETKEQLQFFRDHFVFGVQGYYLSYPLDKEACTQLLMKNT